MVRSSIRGALSLTESRLDEGARVLGLEGLGGASGVSVTALRGWLLELLLLELLLRKGLLWDRRAPLLDWLLLELLLLLLRG